MFLYVHLDPASSVVPRSGVSVIVKNGGSADVNGTYTYFEAGV